MFKISLIAFSAFLATISLTKNALAKDDLKITLGLNSKQFFGGLERNDVFKNELSSAASANRVKTWGMATRNRYLIKADATSDKGFKYGGYLRMNADSGGNSNPGDRTMVYIEGNLGRVEAGSYPSASYSMKANIAEIEKGSGGTDGDIQSFLPGYDGYQSPHGASQNNYFGQRYIVVSDLLIENSNMHTANKVTYISPKINNFQVGFSYTPDTSVSGTVSSFNSTSSDATLQHFIDVLDAVVKYTTKINNYELASTFRYELGGAKQDPDFRRKKMQAWELGAIVKTGKFSYAASYADWRQSGGPSNDIVMKRGGGYWGGAVAFDEKDWGVSLAYMNSKRANLFSKEDKANDSIKAPVFYAGYDRLEMVSLGLDFKLAQGLTQYNEIDSIRTKAAKAMDGQLVSSFRGYGFLSGVKLVF